MRPLKRDKKFVTAKVIIKNDLSKKEMKKIFPLTIGPKSIKYLQINPTKKDFTLQNIAEGNQRRHK